MEKFYEKTGNDVEFSEEQFILRLPIVEAEKVRNALKSLKSKKFKKFLKISIENNRKAIVNVGKQVLNGQLVDLPCIIDSYKTIDKKSIFKTADISQMLICQEEPFNDDITKISQYPHGITPPMKSARKKRFRKVIKNENPDEIYEVKKELIRLFKMDNDAVSTTFQVLTEMGDQVKINDEYIFGENMSDLSDN